MPSFLTQCPHCLTSFRVTDTQLEAAEGLVRCGACLGIFSAAANRITLKQTPEEAAAAAQADEELDAQDADLGEPQDELPAEDVTPPQPSELASTYDAGDLAAEEDSLPPAEQAADDADADLLDTEDFDIPLGDLNLDIDTDSDTGDELHYDEDEDEDEDDDGEADGEDDLAEYDDEVVDAYEDGEDDLDEDEDEDEDDDEDNDEIDPAEEIYEEYTDEDVPAAGPAEGEDSHQTEEFIPEISFEDDELMAEADDAFAAADAVAQEDADYEEEDLGHQEDDFDEEEDLDEEEELPDDDADERTPPLRAPGERVGDKAALRRYLANIEDDDALDPIDDEALDSFVEPVMLDTAPRRSWLVGASLLLANVLLVALLAWQYTAANIDTLSKSSRFAPLLPYACRVVACPAPERSQVDRIVSEQLLVRSHPRYAEALEVSLVFRNDAAEAQPFPALELGFHDTANRLVANRLFTPAEYLPTELQTSEMPAQSSLQVVLELVDPGSEAVNYTLVFRAP